MTFATLFADSVEAFPGAAAFAYGFAVGTGGEGLGGAGGWG